MTKPSLACMPLEPGVCVPRRSTDPEPRIYATPDINLSHGTPNHHPAVSHYVLILSGHKALTSTEAQAQRIAAGRAGDKEKALEKLAKNERCLAHLLSSMYVPPSESRSVRNGRPFLISTLACVLSTESSEQAGTKSALS